MKLIPAFGILAALAGVADARLANTPSRQLVRRRFGQEQAVQLQQKLNNIQGCNVSGDKALGFGGQEIQTLLGAAPACDKIKMADALVAKFRAEGNCSPAGLNELIGIAMDLVVAEHNFNPFNGDEDIICTDPSLPATPELRGLLQKVDPRTAAPNNKDAARAASAARVNQLAEQLLADAKKKGSGPGFGGSMADLVVQNGHQAVKGAKGGAPRPAAPAAPAAAPAAPAAPAPAAPAPAAMTVTVTRTVTVCPTNTAAPAPALNPAQPKGSGGNSGAPPAGANLGACNANAAQLKVGLGVDPDGERAQEIRFVPGGFRQDPIFGRQSSALNPAIVANFICDRLNDECQAKNLVAGCRAAQQAVAGAGLKGGKGKSAAEAAALGKLADDFNRAIGINTNFQSQLGGGAAPAGGQQQQPQMQQPQQQQQQPSSASGANFGAQGCAKPVMVVAPDSGGDRFSLQRPYDHGPALNSRVITDFLKTQIPGCNQAAKDVIDRATAAMQGVADKREAGNRFNAVVNAA
ncbi:hypothetical protein HK102_008850 [Quaeritorhiza haematococci]|nr:hypothetical protein HK102_008850 [Quaeritorhiza haematococci]